jgi:hypothetical protein
LSFLQQLLRLKFPSIRLLHSLRQLLFFVYLLLDLLFLVQDLLSHYLLVVRVEFKCEVVFDKDKSNNKVVSCMVFLFMFFNKVWKIMVNEIVFQKFMITFAVILVPNRVIRRGGSLRFLYELDLFLVFYRLDRYPPSRWAFSDLFASFIYFWQSLILL